MIIKFTRQYTLALCLAIIGSFNLNAQQAEPSAQLETSTINSSDDFGKAVAVDGNYSLIGAWSADEKGPESGAAYIYTRIDPNDEHWSYIKKLTASDGEAFNNFGSQVAIEGDYALVSAQGNDDFAGAVYVFYRNAGGEDNWGELQKLTAFDKESGDVFGTSISINGGQLAVGAYGNDDKGRSAGAVYTYSLKGDKWVSTGKIVDNDGKANDRFGSSVAIENNTLVVGSSRDNKTGSIIIFQNDGKEWQQSLKIFAADKQEKDFFGSSLALDGNTLAVGAYGADAYTGAVYLFDRNLGGAGNWGQMKKIQALDGDLDARFGKAIDLEGENLLIGSQGYQFGMGATYLFKQNTEGENQWGLASKMEMESGDTQDLFGASVALSGDDAIIGAYGSENTGNVYLYKTISANFASHNTGKKGE